MRKSLLFLIIIPILIIIFLLASNTFEFSTNNETTQLEKTSDLKIKTEKLMNAHNAIISNFNNSRVSDPRDYGFDSDLGWSNIVFKEGWCTMTENILFKEYQLLKELDEAINDISNLDDISKKLLENIQEDEVMISIMKDKQKLGHQMLIAFDCENL